MDILIRSEKTADFPAIQALNKVAFGQENEARLVNLLRQSDTFIPALSLVAMMDDIIVGHILFTKIKIKDEQENVFESLALAPMAVQPALQKQGIGEQLIRYGLKKAKALGYQSVIVLGHEHYYPKFGFVPAEKWQIKAPFDVPSNVFMALELVKDGLKGISGTVEYPKEFEAL